MPGQGGTSTVAVEQPTMEELQNQIALLQQDLIKEQEERNYYQLERDKITTMWDISKNELDEVKAGIKNKDREMEELEEDHQVQIKVYKQKVKHRLYEHQNEVNALAKHTASKVDTLDAEHAARVSSLEKARKDLKHDMKETEQQFQNVISSTKDRYAEEISTLKQEHDQMAKQLQANYVKKAKALHRQIELRRKTELAELQNRKNIFIQQLQTNHKRAFDNIKEYYKEITTNNMNLIISLKERVDVLRDAGEKGTQEMFRMQQQLDEALQPLEDSLQEEAELTNKLKIFNKTRNSLQRTTAQLKVTEAETEKQRWESSVLEKEFANVQAERDDLYEKFAAAVATVQERSSLRNLMLEKKIEGLTDEVLRKDAQLTEVLHASNLEPGALNAVTTKLEGVLDSKNAAIRDLEYELARVAKAHNDAVKVYNSKLSEFGIPIEEIGIVPAVDLVQATTAPAGLVSG